MSDIADMVDSLIEAGTPPGLAASIVARAFVAGSQSAPYREDVPRRSAGAERTARWRERHKASQGVTEASQTVTPPSHVTECDAKKGPPDPLKEITTPPLENPTGFLPPEPKPAKPKRATRLDPAWTPSEKNVADAKDLGLSDQHIAHQSGRFRDYWAAQPGQKGVKADWDATWRNWCRRFAEDKGLAPTTGPPATVLGDAKRPIGWRPGLPTNEEILARFDNDARNSEPNREEVLPNGGGVHRAAPGAGPQEPGGS